MFRKIYRFQVNNFIFIHVYLFSKIYLYQLHMHTEFENNRLKMFRGKEFILKNTKYHSKMHFRLYLHVTISLPLIATKDVPES